MPLESALDVCDKIVIFKKDVTQKQVDELNTMNRLKERPIVKVCKLCKHYFRQYGHDKCSRDRYPGYNQVSGKNEILGKEHFCEHNREVDNTYEHSVKDGSICGAIGQFWEPIEPKVGFWAKTIKRIENKLK
jgi:hypothetical protein